MLGGKSLFLPKFEMKLRKNEMKLRKKDFEVRKNLPFLPWRIRISSGESWIKWELAHECRRAKNLEGIAYGKVVSERIGKLGQVVVAMA